MNVISYKDIKAMLNVDDAIRAIEGGFAAYSKGEVTTPPVGHLAFEGGDCHIKYGYRKNAKFFVIKIASGFHGNPQKGLPVGSGLMLVMDAKTGVPLSLLEDQGYLTDIRTAIAGAIAAKYLMPRKVQRIGIVGTGSQARYQLQLLAKVTDGREATVWGRKDQAAETFCRDMATFGFKVKVALSLQALTESSQVIVTTTNAKEPLIEASWVQSGTHITAVGADAPGKRELDPQLLVKADLIVVDSISQCTDHGEVQKATTRGLIARTDLIELGQVIAQPDLGRTSDEQISIVDLTGIAIQDIEIAGLIYEQIRSKR